MQRDEYLRMLLAGTVTFPATFPQLGRLELVGAKIPTKEGDIEPMLIVTESPSSRVKLTRRVPIHFVRAIFQPRDPNCVNYMDGDWLLGGEILKVGLKVAHDLGIAFVREDAPSLLSVCVGMTAAESVQYYPPLPGDPSHNHYNPWRECGDGHRMRPAECCS